MIKLTNVSKRYPSGNLALDNVSLDIDKGEFVFIVGSSGAGKSTLMRLLLREETPTSGRVIVNGRNVGEMKRRDIPYFRRTLGVVFQDFRLIPTMNVYDNVAFALRATNVSNKDIRQRVALARALVNNPDLILADEPTGNIDPELSYEIVELLTEINKVGTTIVMVTHEHELVAQFDHRIIQIEKGRLVADTGKIGGHNGRK